MPARNRPKSPPSADAASAPSDRTVPPPAESRFAHAHERFGWTALCAAVAFGLVLETMLGFKTSAFLLDPLRRELWSLAHFHAATLALVNIVYARYADDAHVALGLRAAASRSMIAGGLLFPAGFLLGGLWHPEGDPGFGILLAPVGGALVVFAAGIRALASWRRA